VGTRERKEDEKMAVRKIIEIDEEKCTGCGECIPNCPEGALQVIDGKARLVSDLFCDGLGACVGNCPVDAMSVVEREAEDYEERTVMENIVKAGPNTIKAHLVHLKEHGAHDYFQEAIAYLKDNGIEIPEGVVPQPGASGEGAACGCPGAAMQEIVRDVPPEREGGLCTDEVCVSSKLENWPVQIKLVPPTAPYLKNADIVIIADCVAYAHAMAHDKFIRGKKVLIGCPKLDERELYVDRLAGIIGNNDLNSITLVHMEVPCCYGFNGILDEAIKRSGEVKDYKEIVVSINGEIKE
jgi:ferredoxin